MSAAKFVLNCKYSGGKCVLNSLRPESTVEQLKCALRDVTTIPTNQLRVLVGFPPKALQIEQDDETLQQICLKSGETLIIDAVPAAPLPAAPVAPAAPPVYSNDHITPASGILLRKVVPANNSCLFTSVDFNLNGGNFNPDSGSSMRKVIADTVAKDTDTFNEAFLGKPNKEYCKWILDQDHWGGAIELSVLSKHYSIEIVAVDTQNVCLHRFGEDESYSSRMLLIYDGIHYDPLTFEDFQGRDEIRTIFPIEDDSILRMALEVAQEARASRQYTDVASFTLKCLVCQQQLKGETQAQQHAKQTGHVNFGET